MDPFPLPLFYVEQKEVSPPPGLRGLGGERHLLTPMQSNVVIGLRLGTQTLSFHRLSFPSTRRRALPCSTSTS